MIKFNKPEQLNGTQLVNELKNAGVIVNTENSPYLDGSGDFWLDIPAKDKSKAELIIETHIGIDTQQAEAEAKAAARQVIADRLGLTADELQVLLG